MEEPNVAANSGQQKLQWGNFNEEPRQRKRPTPGAQVAHGSSFTCLGDRQGIYIEQSPLPRHPQPSLKELFVSKGLMEQLTVS